MADLIDRLTGLSEQMVPPRPAITTHEFEAHFALFATGKWSGAEAQIGLDLQGDELAQMTLIVNRMNAKNATQKVTYGIVVMGVVLALAHVPATVGYVPNVYFSWAGDQLVVNKARVALDLEI